jgi:hypothetical protein
MDYLVRFEFSGAGLSQWSGLGLGLGWMIVYIPGSQNELYYDLSGACAMGIVPKVATDSIHIPADIPRLPVLTSKKALLHYNIRLKLPSFISLSGQMYGIEFELKGPSDSDSGTGKPPIFQYKDSLDLMGCAAGGLDLETSLDTCLEWDGVPRDLLAR